MYCILVSTDNRLSLDEMTPVFLKHPAVFPHFKKFFSFDGFWWLFFDINQGIQFIMIALRRLILASNGQRMILRCLSMNKLMAINDPTTAYKKPVSEAAFDIQYINPFTVDALSLEDPFETIPVHQTNTVQRKLLERSGDIESNPGFDYDDFGLSSDLILHLSYAIPGIVAHGKKTYAQIYRDLDYYNKVPITQEQMDKFVKRYPHLIKVVVEKGVTYYQKVQEDGAENYYE
jgi:hypothetical protein